MLSSLVIVVFLNFQILNQGILQIIGVDIGKGLDLPLWFPSADVPKKFSFFFFFLLFVQEINVSKHYIPSLMTLNSQAFGNVVKKLQQHIWEEY